MLARRGRLSFFGGLPKDQPTITLDSNLVHYRELTIVGANGSSPDHNKRALALIASGEVPVEGPDHPSAAAGRRARCASGSCPAARASRSRSNPEGGPVGMAERSVVVGSRIGLHARPAALFVKAATAQAGEDHDPQGRRCRRSTPGASSGAGPGREERRHRGPRGGRRRRRRGARGRRDGGRRRPRRPGLTTIVTADRSPLARRPALPARPLHGIGVCPGPAAGPVALHGAAPDACRPSVRRRRRRSRGGPARSQALARHRRGPRATRRGDRPSPAPRRSWRRRR